MSASPWDAVVELKQALYGTPEEPRDHPTLTHVDASLIEMLVSRLHEMPFECRCDATQVFTAVLRKEPAAIAWLLPSLERADGGGGGGGGSSSDEGGGSSGSDGGGDRGGGVLLGLLAGCTAPETAIHCGTMLREAIRHEPLARWLLGAPSTFPIICRCLESEHFDVASDAFATARDLLTRHRSLVAAFLEAHYDAFFAQFARLIRSPSYVTKRQSLKLLSEILLDRANFAIMTRFIASPEHLKAIMGLLRDPSPSIQFEAFHVFKIFVANPYKAGVVLELLRRNRERLLAFLESFLPARALTDDGFRDEKAFTMDQMRKLEPWNQQGATARAEA